MVNVFVVLLQGQKEETKGPVACVRMVATTGEMAIECAIHALQVPVGRCLIKVNTSSLTSSVSARRSQNRDFQSSKLGLNSRSETRSKLEF
jgi:hypothetical protein